jgi:subtilase family serine protease
MQGPRLPGVGGRLGALTPYGFRVRTSVLLLATMAFALGLGPAAHAAPRVTFYFGLERPEGSARVAWNAVGDPRSATYRHFLSAPLVARRYGASASTIRRFRRGVRRRGLGVQVDRSRVFARVTGTVPAFEDLLDIRLRKQFNNDVNANGWFAAGKRPPRPPRGLRPLVREIVTSYSRSTRPPTASSAQATPQPGNAGTWTEGCDAARATGAYAFGQVRNAYGVPPGTGARVAILNAGEGAPQRDVDTAGACFGLPGLHTRTLLTDGQSKPFGRGTFEPQEDIALVRGMAPGLGSATFAQVWLAPELWFLGAARVLDERSRPDAFSISYGECERDIRGRAAAPASRAGANLLDALLVRLGLAGVSVFASAGDFGSTCNGQPFPGVAWPASSPYLTAVGGSRLVLDAANERVDEVVWNDLEWLSTDNGGGAGGGGLSAVSARPPYQRAVAARRRAVPDVSAHASMLPGWPVVIGTNWVEDAGTSASAPLVAGAFAVLSARERAAGRPPLGPVNGLLYDSAPQTVFDVVSGENGYDRRVRARQAGPGYDLASGLGVPRFDVLAATLPPPPPS